MEYFVSTVFSPAVTLVVLSWCCFWISRHAVPARVSLGITTILTAIVLFGSVNEAMPPVSYSKAQDYFLLVSFGFIFVSFLEFVIVLHTDPDPGWLRWLRRCCKTNSYKVFIIIPSYKLQHIQDPYEKCRKNLNSFCSGLTLLDLIILHEVQSMLNLTPCFEWVYNATSYCLIVYVLQKGNDIIDNVDKELTLYASLHGLKHFDAVVLIFFSKSKRKSHWNLEKQCSRKR